MTPANPPRFCAHIFFVRKGIAESLVVKAPTLKEIEYMFLTKLVVNTGRPEENFKLRVRMLARATPTLRLPYPIWEIACTQAPGAWVKVHRTTESCPSGWAT